MPTEIAVPFRVTEDGSIAVETDPDRQIHQHVMALVTTRPGSRVMLPDYGLDVAGMLFEPDDHITIELLRQRTKQAFDTYEPGVLVQALTPSEVNSDGLVELEIEYERRDSANSPSGVGRNSNTATILVGGQVIERVRG